MDSIKKIVYTNLTDAEFFNLNKPPKTEIKGGGQGYIDFSTSMINVAGLIFLVVLMMLLKLLVHRV
jgi:5-methylcytosine-specific restriction protein A